uniref:Uncharacterized protein n=1 Tax=Oryza punctata TaxID=4537 RepID=A0A0E0LCA1_ORYPU
MAVVDHRGDKENVPPAAARLHGGVAVKKLKLKRLGNARRRVPLRDITNLFLATASVDSAAATEREAPPRGQPLEPSSEHAEVEFPPPPAPAPLTATAKSWLAGGVALKPGRCSLRKEFR